MMVMLGKAGVGKLSDIAADIGQVSLASIALPFLFDAQEPVLAGAGLIMACAMWIISVYLKRKSSAL